ncbi:MAG: DUF441 family protein, partial [Bacillota bacterium]
MQQNVAILTAVVLVPVADGRVTPAQVGAALASWQGVAALIICAFSTYLAGRGLEMQHLTSPAGRRPTWAMDLALVGVAASWGVNHVVVKHTLANMMPLAFNALRFGLASATLLGILWLVEGDVGVKRRDLWPVLGVGVLGHTVYQTLFIT